MVGSWGRACSRGAAGGHAVAMDEGRYGRVRLAALMAPSTTASTDRTNRCGEGDIPTGARAGGRHRRRPGFDEKAAGGRPTAGRAALFAGGSGTVLCQRCALVARARAEHEARRLAHSPAVLRLARHAGLRPIPAPATPPARSARTVAAAPHRHATRPMRWLPLIPAASAPARAGKAPAAAAPPAA